MAIRFIECVLLSAFLAMVGYGLGWLVGVVISQFIEHNADLGGIRETIARRARIERGMEARLRDRRAEHAKLDREFKELVRKRLALEHAATESLEVADHIMRVVGDEVAGRQRFLALVFNKYLAGSGSGGGAHHSLIDPAWAVAQEIEVWSIGVAEARIELEKRYPPAFGYSVSSLVAAQRESSGEPAPQYAG